MRNVFRSLPRSRDTSHFRVKEDQVVAPFESDEEHLARDVAELDRSSPGWREGSRVANAKHRLEQGLPEATVIAIFGEATTREALAQLGAR